MSQVWQSVDSETRKVNTFLRNNDLLRFPLSNLFFSERIQFGLAYSGLSLSAHNVGNISISIGI